VHVLLTTSTPEAGTLLHNSLPSRVGLPVLLQTQQIPQQLCGAFLRVLQELPSMYGLVACSPWCRWCLAAGSCRLCPSLCFPCTS
jgi:hypothetical protein